MTRVLGAPNHCFEAWHCHSFDLWQEIENLPKGMYQLEVQGYVRCEVPSYVRGEELGNDYPSPVYLYMNNAVSQFPSVYSECPEDLGHSLEIIESWTTETVNGKQYPNSMGGAAQCFSWGMYKTTANGLIAKDGDKFRIGVKMDANQDWWCIFDNFKLTYREPTAEVVKPVLEEELAKYDLALIEGSDIYEQVSKVLGNAKTALASNDGVQMFDALVAVYDVSGAYLDALTELYAEGRTFTANTVEGVAMTFKVTSNADKQCQVGIGEEDSPAVNKSTTGTLTIPSEVNGYSVTSIGEYAFDNCYRLTSVTIPNSVTSIGSRAFWYCGKLTSVTIPNSVTNIGDDVFLNCDHLTSITIPNSVTSIGDGVFRSCHGLTSIMVESGNTVYDSRGNCNAIIKTETNELIVGCKNTVIPNSVTSIGDYAFGGCSGLTSVTIPNSVTSIGERAFEYCHGLTSVTIPSSVTSIGEAAFYGCSGLTSVTIPNSVTSIGIYAFYNCSGLTDVYSLIEEPSAITNSVFNYYDNGASVFTSATLYVPAGTKAKYEATDGWKNFKNIEEMETGGNDMTNFIVNPGFEDGIQKATNPNGYGGDYGTATGWTADKNSYGNFTPGPLGSDYDDTMTRVLGAPNHCFEAWHCRSFDLWQEIENLPKGMYQLEVQGYVRCEVPSYVRGEELGNDYPSPVYLYMNNAVSQFPSVYSECPEDLGHSLEIIESWTTETVNGKQYPNSMGGAAQCFSWGMYKTTANGLIAKDGDKFRIGVKMDANQNWWCIFDNFKLTYREPTAGVVKPVLEEELAKYDLALIEGSDIYEQVSKVLGNAKTALASNNGEQMFDALVAVYDISGAYLDALTELYAEGRTFTANTVEGVAMTFKVTSNADKQCQVGIGEEDSPAVNKSTTGTLTIPSEVNGFSVTSIGEYAFYGCNGLTSVTIPNSVTSIEWCAFNGCSGLTSVTIPNSVTNIGDNAFYHCIGLTSIKVESANTVYDSRDNCNAIINTETNELIAGCKNTVIPNSVTSIGAYAFYDCYRLTSVTIPNSVTSISHGAFMGSGLTSVTIPNSVTNMGESVFGGCSGLTSIVVENGNAVYDSRGNCNAIIETATNKLITGCQKTVIPNSVTSIGDEAFQGCSGLTSVTIPNSVTSIGAHAFYNCNGLTSVTIPYSVTSIEDYAFAYCYSLTEVHSQIAQPFVINANVFRNLPADATLYVPAGMKETYIDTDGWNVFSSIVEDAPVAVTGLTLNKANMNLRIGSTTKLKATVIPENAANKDVTWSTSDNTVATVDADGTVKGIKEGVATITCVSAETPTISAQCTITVKDSDMAGDLNVDDEIDVTDVVELIDMVLAGSTDPSGDINGDGEVDVTDVVELIDMVLAGE